MVRSSGQRQVVWMMVVVLGLLALAPMASAKPPSAEARTQCEGEGYRSVATAEGVPFKNAAKCIKYVTQGGTLVSAPRIIRDFHINFVTETSSWCESSFELRDFPAFTAVHVEIYGYIAPEYEPVVHDVVTDASGSSNAGSLSQRPGTTEVIATFTASTGEVVTIVATFPCTP